MAEAWWDSERYFEWRSWEYGSLFQSGQPVWAALAGLSELLAEATRGAGAPGGFAGSWFAGDVILGVGVKVEPGVFVQGPAIIGDRVELRQGCYVRGDVLVGADAVVGHCSELKHAILWPKAKAPHFNYVGDSILGRDVNLGAGTICSNVNLAKGHVVVRSGGGRQDTGLRKLGAILGDGCQTGCNVVLNPGTLAERDCRFLPLTSAAGHFKAGTTVRVPVQVGRG